MRRGRQAQECHPVPSRAMADEHSSVAEPATDPKTDVDAASPFLGPNAWLVEEMYEQYRADPASVSENWQEFFADYRSSRPEPATAAAPAPAAAAPLRRPRRPSPPRRRRRPPLPAAAPPAPPAAAADPAGEPIRGAGALIVANMERSLGVPTATSFRNVPAKLLEVNRKVINGYLRPHGQRQGQLHPPHRLRRRAGHRRRRAGHEQHLRRGRRRQAARRPQRPREHGPRRRRRRRPTAAARWSCPCSATPTRSTSPASSPPTRTSSARSGPTSSPVDDFQGATITLTNPGTIGTVQSRAPPDARPGRDRRRRHHRLPGRVPGRRRASPRRARRLARSSRSRRTYDHRIIQGAESGMFLKRVHELLLGEHGFYDDVFRVARRALRRRCKWRRDVSPIDREEAMLAQADAGGHARSASTASAATSSPTSTRWRWKEPKMHDELDPATYGLTIWDLDREFLTGGVGGHGDACASATCSTCCATRTAARSASSTCTSRTPTSSAGSSRKVEGVKPSSSATDEQRHLLERLNAAEAFEKFLATKYVGTKRFGLEGAESAIPILDTVLSAAADDGLDGVGARHGPPRPAQRAGQHRRQELRPDLPGVRGPRRPDLGPGLGRREVPPRRDRQVRQPVGRRHQGRAGRQPEPPRDRRPGRARHGAGQAGPDRPARLVSRCCRS